MRIREYRKRDASAIRVLLDSLIDYGNSILPEEMKKFEELNDRRKALDYCIRLNYRKNWKTFVCEYDDGRLTGFITGGVEKEMPGYKLSKYGNIEIFFVEEGFRGMGAGKLLEESMRGWFAGKGCDAVKVDTWLTNSGAREAYKKMGFREIAVTLVKEICES